MNDYIDNLKYEYIISETGLLFKRLYHNRQGSIRMTLDNGKRISVRKIINKCDKDLEIIRYDTDILLIINRIKDNKINFIFLFIEQTYEGETSLEGELSCLLFSEHCLSSIFLLISLWMTGNCFFAAVA